MTDAQNDRRPLRAVVLNDTSGRSHHGCARVMRLLVAGLQRHGVETVARGLAHQDWQANDQVMAALPLADVIVINGEGTLHHGRPAGEVLLRITQHPARGAVPVVLVNALYQENPDSWAACLKQLALISARDQASATEISQATGQSVGWLPDLSLSQPSAAAARPRQGNIVGDSVKMSVRQSLARGLRYLPKARYVPTKTLSNIIWRLPVVGAVLRHALFAIYTMTSPRPGLRFLLPQTEMDYLSELSGAEGHLTGRFHAICLSLLTETPFLAVTSNSRKIEQLLKDAGLNPARVIGLDKVSAGIVIPAFDADELAGMRRFQDLAQSGAEDLYARIAALAQHHRVGVIQPEPTEGAVRSG